MHKLVNSVFKKYTNTSLYSSHTPSDPLMWYIGRQELRWEKGSTVGSISAVGFLVKDEPSIS